MLDTRNMKDYKTGKKPNVFVDMKLVEEIFQTNSRDQSLRSIEMNNLVDRGNQVQNNT